MEIATENKMGTAPIFKLIMTMSLPAMFSMLVQAMYNIVDSYFVAQISEDALTAVSLIFPIQNLLIAVGVGTAVGINSLVARRLGEKNRGEANSAATHGIVLGFFNFILFFVLGLFFSRLFMQGFTQDESIIEMGTQYMSIVCMFSFGLLIEVNIEKTLQATGNMIYPMVFQLIGAVTNIILDPAFIFGFGPIPALGVAGAAIATVIGQILAMVVSLIVIFFKKHEVQITFRGFRLEWTTIKNIYAVGFPSILMQSIGSLMVMGMNAILIAFNNTAVAFFGIYFKLQSFVFMPVFGLTQGLMPIMGYNYGARKKSRLLSTIKIGNIIAVIIMAIGVVLFWVFPEQFLQIFNADRAMIEMGVPALQIISLCFIPAALGITFSTVFQAVGTGLYSLIVSVLRQLVILLPAAYLLAKLGLNAVWYSLPIAEVFSFVASILIFSHLYKKSIRPMSEQA